MDKLKQLLSLCKCGVYVTVNEHRDYYNTAAQALEESDDSEHPWDITPDMRAKMIETNTIIEIQVYPNSPVGFNLVYHYDLEAALDEALSSIQPCEGCRRAYPKNASGQHVWPSGIGGGDFRECIQHCACGALLWFQSERNRGSCQKCAVEPNQSTPAMGSNPIPLPAENPHEPGRAELIGRCTGLTGLGDFCDTCGFHKDEHAQSGEVR